VATRCSRSFSLGRTLPRLMMAHQSDRSGGMEYFSVFQTHSFQRRAPLVRITSSTQTRMRRLRRPCLVECASVLFHLESFLRDNLVKIT